MTIPSARFNEQLLGVVLNGNGQWGDLYSFPLTVSALGSDVVFTYSVQTRNDSDPGCSVFYRLITTPYIADTYMTGALVPRDQDFHQVGGTVALTMPPGTYSVTLQGQANGPAVWALRLLMTTTVLADALMQPDMKFHLTYTVRDKAGSEIFTYSKDWPPNTPLLPMPRIGDPLVFEIEGRTIRAEVSNTSLQYITDSLGNLRISQVFIGQEV